MSGNAQSRNEGLTKQLTNASGRFAVPSANTEPASSLSCPSRTQLAFFSTSKKNIKKNPFYPKYSLKPNFFVEFLYFFGYGSKLHKMFQNLVKTHQKYGCILQNFPWRKNTHREGTTMAGVPLVELGGQRGRDEDPVQHRRGHRERVVAGIAVGVRLLLTIPIGP